MHIAPDNSSILVCSRSLHIRRISLREPYAILKSWRSGHEAPILVSSIDPTSTLFASGSADATIRVWDIQGGYCTHQLRGHSSLVSSISFDSTRTDGRVWLASGGEDGSVRVWDLKETGKKQQKFVFHGHTSVVRSLAFTEDGKRLVSVGRDRLINVWSLETGKNLLTFPVYESLESVGLVPSSLVALHANVWEVKDDDLVCWTAGEKGILRLWNLTTSSHIIDQPVYSKIPYTITEAISIHETNQILAVTSEQTLLFHDLPSFKRARQLVGFHDQVLDLRLLTSLQSTASEDASVLMATNSNQARLIRLRDQQCDFLEGHEDMVLSVTYQDGLCATGSKDNTAKLWKLDWDEDHAKIRLVGTCSGHTESVGTVCLSPQLSSVDGMNDDDCVQFLLTGSQDRTIKRWDMTMDLLNSTQQHKLKSRYTIQAHDKDINAVVLSPTYTVFATASQDKTVKVWVAEDARLLGTCMGHKRGVWDVKFSPVEQVMATASGDKTIKLWSLRDFSCVKTLQGHGNSVLKVAFLSLGMQLASASADGLVKLWTLKTEECVTTMDNHTEKIWALDVSHDESVIVSGGGDGIVTVWEDRTELENEEKRLERARLLEMEQELTNRLVAEDYAGAVKVALELKQPRRLLELFKRLLNEADVNQATKNHTEDHRDRRIYSGSLVVDELIAGIQGTNLSAFLGYVRDWNTDGRHALVSQRLLKAVFGTHDLNKLQRVDGLRSVLDALIPYSQRHYEHIEDALMQLYLIDYTLSCMGVVPDADITMDDHVNAGPE